MFKTKDSFKVDKNNKFTKFSMKVRIKDSLNELLAYMNMAFFPSWIKI